MNESDSGPPAQKVTKDEIMAAINEICEKRGQPVVRSQDIADLDSIPVGKQAINGHLDELKEMGRVNFLEYGPGGVWWVPDNTETDLEIDMGAVDWNNIDATDIPHEVLAELPEFQDQTYWESARDTWGTVAGGATFLLFAALLLGILRQNTPLQLGEDAQAAILLTMAGGFSVAALSIGLVFAAKFGQRLEDEGIAGKIRRHSQDAKHKIVQAIQNRLPDTEG